MKRVMILINKLILDRKIKSIELKYYNLFMLLDLDYYQYLELQRMKNKELNRI